MSGEESPDAASNPPREAASEECCRRGCETCVFDRYFEALERHCAALQSWLGRLPDAQI